VVSVTQTEAQDGINSIPVLGTEPASESRIRSCCGSAPGIRFYCKPVTLVRCREIRGENRFSGRVGGKWLCEMTSAFIIKKLRGARALRLFCGRSAFPPPFKNKNRPPTAPGCWTVFVFLRIASGLRCFQGVVATASITLILFMSPSNENFRKDFKVVLDFRALTDDISSDKSGIINGAVLTSED